VADSRITKKHLAEALKGLMKEESFGKISVSDVCEKCNMNRKSFYYHFKDKYDLMNWIFDSEAAACIKKARVASFSELVSVFTEHFWSNRDFYRKALETQGQNSFTEHLRNRLFSIILMYIGKSTSERELNVFKAKFYADAIVCSIDNWLSSKEPLSCKEISLFICSAIDVR